MRTLINILIIFCIVSYVRRVATPSSRVETPRHVTCDRSGTVRLIQYTVQYVDCGARSLRSQKERSTRQVDGRSRLVR